ncbi:MAG TPA: DUF4114 domain-containing protein [Vicinamibacterales bacterium]|nr:DUF4114 domain-containing protein [Vicinamibacterales bacterium]
MTRPCTLLGTVALVAALAAPAQAVPITEQTLIATGGDVLVTFVSNGAGYTSELYLDGSLGDDLGAIFNNVTTAVGTTINLGSFAEGTDLIFRLLVTQTGDVFYTGDGSLNPDGVAHALLENGDGQVLVGFEDLFGGGDLDYNDLVFAFTNVALQDESGGSASGESGGSTSNGDSSGSASNGAGGSGVVTPGSGVVTQAGPVGALPVAVDEPGTLLMLGSGLLMLVFAMKRQSVRR